MRVRKPPLPVLVSRDLLGVPLLVEVARAANEQHPPEVISQLDQIGAFCEAALCEGGLDQLPYADRFVLAEWAVSPSIEPAQFFGEEAQLVVRDVQGIVHAQAASLIDMICRRYRQTPSQYLGMESSLLAADFDMAIAYRASQSEHKAMKGEDEVEVEDVWGNKIKVPRSKLVQYDHKESGAEVMHADDLYAKYGPFSMSAGGDPTGSMDIRGAG